MLPILQFIFSSFWIWAGSVVLLSILATGVAAAFDGALKTLVLLIRRGE